MFFCRSTIIIIQILYLFEKLLTIEIKKKIIKKIIKN